MTELGSEYSPLWHERYPQIIPKRSFLAPPLTRKRSMSLTELSPIYLHQSKGCQLPCHGPKTPRCVCCQNWSSVCSIPPSPGPPTCSSSSPFLVISPCVNSIKGLLTAILGHALAHGLWFDGRRPDTLGGWKRNFKCPLPPPGVSEAIVYLCWKAWESNVWRNAWGWGEEGGLELVTLWGTLTLAILSTWNCHLLALCMANSLASFRSWLKYQSTSKDSSEHHSWTAAPS